MNAAKEDVRRGHLTNLVHRLAEQGFLRPACTQRKALATLLLLMSFETFDMLYGRCQMSVESVSGTLVDAAERTLLA